MPFTRLSNLNADRNADLTTRALLLALLYSILWIAAHWIFATPHLGLSWIFPQLLSSLLIFLSMNGLFIAFNYYRRGWIGKIFVTLFYFQPVFQISYYQTYKTFLEQQNFSLLLREPQFVINVFAKEISVSQGLLFLAIFMALYFLNSWFLSKPASEGLQPKPFFFFHSKWFDLFLLIAVGTQIKWCLKHDPSQLSMRPFYPIAGFAILSILVFLFRTQHRILKKCFWILALLLNVTQLYALNMGFPEFRDKMSLDSRYYRALFGAYFVNTAMNSLDQTEQAHEKFIQLPKAEMNYNILLVLDDSQRWDFSERHGYGKESDRQLNWFYDQAYDFQFPLSPANFTDTSVPAILTGLGSNRDVLQIKGSLTLWDYFAKGAETFFISSQSVDWSKLNLFYQSIGQKHLWSAVVQPEFKKNQELVDDSYLIKEFNRYTAEQKEKGQHWVGALQMFSSHYPYNHYPPAPQPYAPCDLTRESGPKNFINCYANGQVSAAWAKNDVLKAVDLSNTIVILTSDHGEGFNEHGIWFHGIDYHQEMIKVPLFLYLPPQIKQKIPAELLQNLQANTRRVMSVMDLVPTLLEIHEILTGQKLVADPSVFSGQSLLHPWKDRLIFSSHCFPQYRCYSREIAFVNDDHYVLFRPSEGFYKIYDTFKDLHQTQPLDPHQIPKEELDRIVEQAAATHSIGQSLKAYYEIYSQPQK